MVQNTEVKAAAVETELFDEITIFLVGKSSIECNLKLIIRGALSLFFSLPSIINIYTFESVKGENLQSFQLQLPFSLCSRHRGELVPCRMHFFPRLLLFGHGDMSGQSIGQ
jgi:hypothetical protein